MSRILPTTPGCVIAVSIALALALVLAFELAPSSHGDTACAQDGAKIYLPVTLRSAAPKREGEVLRLLFSERQHSDPAFRDTSSMGNHAYCRSTGCPTFGVVTKAGTSISFSHTDQVVRVPDAPSLHLDELTDLTLEAWLLPTVATGGSAPIISKLRDGRGYELRLGDGSGRHIVELEIGDGNRTVVTRSVEQVTLNRWHHIVATVDRPVGVSRLFLDGHEVAYSRQEPLGTLGSLSNDAELSIAAAFDQDNRYRGLIDEVGVLHRSVADKVVSDTWKSRELDADQWFPRWNSGQVMTVLSGFGLDVNYSPGPVTVDDHIDLSLHYAEATKTYIDYEYSIIMTFAAYDDQAATLDDLKAITPEGEWAVRLLVRDNVIVWIKSSDAAKISTRVAYALATGTTASVLDAPQNTSDADFEAWAKFYPTDRGQLRDASRGRSQRTFDRWETPTNKWLFGQATWMYQDPDGGDAPPSAMPSAFDGDHQQYYYHYHCEEQADPDVTRDCTNWQIYIELLAEGDDGLTLNNWARGGWQGLEARDVRWEAYYRPSAFSRCDGNTVRDESDGDLLRDASVKVPLSFRLPNTVGAFSSSPEVCAVVFDSYLYRPEDVSKAEVWRTMTTMLGREPEPADGREIVQAENRTYRFDRVVNGLVDGDKVYRLWAREVYWVREYLSDKPLEGGMQAYWYGTWDSPPEHHSDFNSLDRWADMQWCHIDTEKGPPGLGALVCEP